MGATYRTGKQGFFSLLAAVSNLILSILWVRSIGPEGVLLATIVSYVIFIVLVQTWEVKRILRGDFLVSFSQEKPVNTGAIMASKSSTGEIPLEEEPWHV
jgi:O-antigen/teichoic acid export membrane protein